MSNYDFSRNWRRTADPEFTTALERVREAFNAAFLSRVCSMHERDFADHYKMSTHAVAQPAPNDFFVYRASPSPDKPGSNVLAVAHLDTCMPHHQRTARFVDTEAGLVVFSGALDDRLGAYIILELLPALGIHHDVLLTVGEEDGQSTAAFFNGSETKDWNWLIEFDRGGTDVVTYQYEDEYTTDLVSTVGAHVGSGAFSDISFMDHLGVKAFNWGVGYQDYHGPRSHAFLEDTFEMVARYLMFHERYADEDMPHTTPEGMNWWNPTKPYKWHGDNDGAADDGIYDEDGYFLAADDVPDAEDFADLRD